MKSVITCDLEGLIETINPDGEKLFGYSKEELVGKKRVSIFLMFECGFFESHFGENHPLWCSTMHPGHKLRIRHTYIYIYYYYYYYYY